MSSTPTPTQAPTEEQCSENAIVPLEGGVEGTAFWWPQMDGYAAKAIAYKDEEISGGGCLSVLVWHDGCFPFSGRCNNCGSPREPVHLHLCSAEQWLNMAALFGKVSGTIVEITETDGVWIPMENTPLPDIGPRD